MPDGPELDTRPLDAAGRTTDGWLLGGRYRVLDRVGTGGMAEVFRAHDELLDRDVAVKVFRTQLDDPDATLNAANRRELELQAMARLNHPNLVTLFDGSVAGEGPAYLVLEFVGGADLATRLRSGPLPEPAARELGAQIADALAYVHAHGLVHRDVKPANILLDDAGGRARLSDFGVVRMVGRPAMTSAELTIGTAYYLAPEQARGSAVGPEADVYALGLVLLEALTGARAFDGPMHEALAARLTTDPTIPADLPAPWPGLLAAMTARDPAQRPDAAAVAAQLRPGAATGPLAAMAPLPLAPVAADAATAAALAAAAEPAFAAGPPSASVARRRRRLHPGLLAAAVAVGAAVALGAYLLPGHADQPGGTPTTGPTLGHSSSAPHRTHRTSLPAANVVDQSVTHGKKSPRPHKSKHETASSTRAAAPAASSPAAGPSTSASVTSSAPATSASAPTTSAPASGTTNSTTAAAAAADPTDTSSPAGP